MGTTKNLIAINKISGSVSESEDFSQNNFQGKPVISYCHACKETLSDDLPFVLLTERQLKNSSRYKNLIVLLDLGSVKALPCPNCGYLNQFVCFTTHPETGVMYAPIDVQAIITDFIRSADYQPVKDNL